MVAAAARAGRVLARAASLGLLAAILGMRWFDLWYGKFTASNRLAHKSAKSLWPNLLASFG